MRSRVGMRVYVYVCVRAHVSHVYPVPTFGFSLHNVVHLF